jgi:hypothetical protein
MSVVRIAISAFPFSYELVAGNEYIYCPADVLREEVASP